MAGTIVSDTLQDGAGNSTATTNAIKGSAKAWIVHNGTSILSSYNVSSITNPSSGRYLISFTTAMPTANYVTQISGADNSSYVGTLDNNTFTPTASQVQVAYINTSIVATNVDRGSVTIFSN